NDLPTGLWFGIFTLYATVGVNLFGSQIETLRVLEFSLILCGVFAIILSLTGFIEKLAKFFTPTVVGTTLLLLVALVSKFFIQGMTNVHSATDSIDLKSLAISIFVIILTYILMNKPKLKQYAVLISILVGWGLFIALGMNTPYNSPDKLIALPQIFPYGLPKFEPSMFVTVFICTLLLFTNLLGSVKIAESVLIKHDPDIATGRLKQAGVIFGINSILCGSFGTIGLLPTSEGSGFVVSTGMTKRTPLIIGSILTILISLFPPAIALFATLPGAVGYAALFPPFIKMTGFALDMIYMSENKDYMKTTVGLSILVGVGIMFMPANAFKVFPPVLSTFLSNGMIVGSVIALICEVYRIKFIKVML
ncbi:MAG: purine/pyrimidine permease, partial [Cetobacterium sp.]